MGTDEAWNELKIGTDTTDKISMATDSQKKKIWPQIQWWKTSMLKIKCNDELNNDNTIIKNFRQKKLEFQTTICFNYVF